MPTSLDPDDTIGEDQDPFDVALPLYYAKPPQHSAYRQLVELGAAAGDPLAQYAMATWFLFGQRDLGVRPNARRAVALLSRAAKTLNRAMYDLASCKLRGHGTRRDDRGAYRLLVRAAGLVCIPAMRAQAFCLREGVGARRDASAASRIEKAANRLAKKRDNIQRRVPSRR